MDVKRIVGWPRRLFLWPALLAMGLAGCASTPPAGPSRPGTQGVARNDLQHYNLDAEIILADLMGVGREFFILNNNDGLFY